MEIENNNEQNNNQAPVKDMNNNKTTGNSKLGVGVVCGIFLGLWGLLFLLVFKEGEERRTFIKGWLWAFIISTIVAVVAVVLMFVLFGASVASLFDWARTVTVE